MSHEKKIREKATSFVVDVWNQRAYSLIPEIMANPVLLHIKGRDINSTHEQLRNAVDRWHERYHEFHFDTDALIVDGDMVALLLTLRGLPVDAKEAEPIAIRHVFILRFEDSAIVEVWELNDFP
jgi:predicted ester cyclase